MAKIKKLPIHEIQKIAAGEVVERPANVVKELLENALDAGATNITLYLEEGGKDLIRIIDNGCGMNREDAHMSIVHHATSKITGIHDLHTLSTFGFRGEALSSISSVSNCTLVTKETSALEGLQLTIDGGTIVSETIVACPPGTDITIKNLFYNVPARRKFLKTRDTEWRAILTLVQAYCMAYPGCHIKMYHDIKLVLNCAPAPSIQARLEQIFDSSITSHLVACSTGNDTSAARITGYITDPQYSRYDRSMLFFFVNKRWVRNGKLGNALMHGYAQVLPAGKFPIACISIDIDPQHVDINIHPRKEEVQFLYPQRVEQLIKTMVAQRLEQYRSTQLSPSSSPTINNRRDYPLFAQPLAAISPTSIAGPAVTYHQFNSIIEDHFETDPSKNTIIPSTTVQDTIAESNEIKNSHRLIGQVHATYILLETQEGLVLVDQHAAHERILYEQFAQRFHDMPRVPLIFPPVITLSQKDSLVLQQHIDLFNVHGISIDQQREGQFIITALPVHAKEQNMQEFIHQVIGWAEEFHVVEKTTFFAKMHERMRAQMACKAAVKAGDTLTTQQMQELVTKLNNTDNRLTCPHGRPTSWLLTRYELEKTFKRKR